MGISIFPPAIIVESDLEKNIRGRARGFLVKMNKNLTAEQYKSTLAHELIHVWQFWVLLLIGLVLFFGFSYAFPSLTILHFIPTLLPFLIVEYIPTFNYRKEAAAYAASVRHGRSLKSAIRALVSPNYKFEITWREAEELITDRLTRRFWGGHAIF